MLTEHLYITQCVPCTAIRRTLAPFVCPHSAASSHTRRKFAAFPQPHRQDGLEDAFLSHSSGCSFYHIQLRGKSNEDRRRWARKEQRLLVSHAWPNASLSRFCGDRLHCNPGMCMTASRGPTDAQSTLLSIQTLTCSHWFHIQIDLWWPGRPEGASPRATSASCCGSPGPSGLCTPCRNFDAGIQTIGSFVARSAPSLPRKSPLPPVPIMT